MKLRDYLIQSARTEKQLPPDETIRHGIIGCVTELGELADTIKKHVIYGKKLDVENLKEEIGDFMWYVAVLARAYNIKDIQGEPDYERYEVSPKLLMDFIDYLTCAVGYMIENPEQFGDVVVKIYAGFYNFSQNVCGVTLEEVFRQNIAKLMERYKTSYTDADALARADKTCSIANCPKCMLVYQLPAVECPHCGASVQS